MSAESRRYWLSGSPGYHIGYRALRLPFVLVVVTALVLVADALTRSVGVQLILGACAFLAVVLVTHRQDETERRQVWICVAVGTLVELFGSILWGVYRYRLGDIPLYVPPGHGLVYLCALRIAGAASLQGWSSPLRQTARIAAATWMIAGISLFPLLGGRFDFFGALWFAVFLMLVRRPDRGTFFAAIFLVTSLLEIGGTAVGDWQWQPVAPYLGLSVGNPPSVIAGAYGCLDVLVLLGFGFLQWGSRLSTSRNRERPPLGAM